MTTSFHAALPAADLVDGAPKGVIVNGWPVLLVRAEGKLSAVIDRCTHAASELSSGRVRRGAVMCPLHGARFDLATGKCMGGAYKPLMVFDVREMDGTIEVAVPDEQPGFEHLPIRPRS